MPMRSWGDGWLKRVAVGDGPTAGRSPGELSVSPAFLGRRTAAGSCLERRSMEEWWEWEAMLWPQIVARQIAVRL